MKFDDKNTAVIIIIVYNHLLKYYLYDFITTTATIFSIGVPDGPLHARVVIVEAIYISIIYHFPPRFKNRKNTTK